jgi:Zn-dependent protease with chaperone function
MTAVGSLATAVTAPLTALKAAVGGYTLSLWLSRPVTANAVRGYMQAQLQAATRPGPATTILVQQAQQKLFAAAGSEGMPAEPPNAVSASAPARAASPAQPAPAPQQDFAGNQTVQALLQRGVHPTNARQAVGNPQLAVSMLRSPQLYAEPGTPAERIIAHRLAEGSAVGGVW